MVIRKQLPKCPVCRAEFHIKHVDFTLPFHCPACDRYLCVPRSYPRLQGCVALLISGLLSYIFGARGPTLVLITLFAWIPAFFVVVFWTRHFAPPKLKPCTPDDSHYSGPLGLGPDSGKTGNT
jgi:hypothetical protein